MPPSGRTRRLTFAWGEGFGVETQIGEDLGKLAQAVQPRWLVPIHTFCSERYGEFGVPVRRLEKGETLEL